LPVYHATVCRLRSRRHRRYHQRGHSARAAMTHNAGTALRWCKGVKRRLRHFAGQLCHASMCRDVCHGPTPPVNTIKAPAGTVLSVVLITQIKHSPYITAVTIKYKSLLSRCSRQRARLSASMLSTCSSVCRSICRQTAKNATFLTNKQFRAMVSIDDLQEVM